ncbi:MAG: hypothetical protein H6719_10325 [Sandaracinaceae bacterium]|nr:hypothetical protein [Sandaracinaceae bacterium]
MKTSDEKQFGRRGALVGIGVAAAGIASVTLPRELEAQAATPAPSHPDSPMGPPDALAAHALVAPGDDVRALFGPLTVGEAIGSHWRLEALYGVRAGAIPLILSTRSGARFGVEVLRSGEASPLASAGPLGLYLVNRGDGSQVSDESAGLGVVALASALEARLAAGAPVPSALTTLEERRRRHPAGVFHIPVT